MNWSEIVKQKRIPEKIFVEWHSTGSREHVFTIEGNQSSENYPWLRISNDWAKYDVMKRRFVYGDFNKWEKK